MFEEQKGLALHGEHLEKTISDAGFEDVKVRRVTIFLGGWDGRICADHELF